MNHTYRSREARNLMGFWASGCILPANRASQAMDGERAALFCLFYFPSAVQTDTLIKSIETNYWENEIKNLRSLPKLQGPIFLLLDRTDIKFLCQIAFKRWFSTGVGAMTGPPADIWQCQGTSLAVTAGQSGVCCV